MTAGQDRIGMSKETISVRIERDKKAALDAIAAQSDRDLNVIVEEE
jgi:predicted transcriptional regulator